MQPRHRGNLGRSDRACNELMKHLNNTRLCFDPAIPSRFTVFAFMHTFTGIISVEVYSSET